MSKEVIKVKKIGLYRDGGSCQLKDEQDNDYWMDRSVGAKLKDDGSYGLIRPGHPNMEPLPEPITNKEFVCYNSNGEIEVLLPLQLKDSSKSFQEDYFHENGNYQNKCCRCKQSFIGHKRRVVCKECANADEFIICSAVWFKDGKVHTHQPINVKEGFVIAGRRHHNCYATLTAVSETLGINLKPLIEKTGRDGQGFITSKDRYLNRKEAFPIAKAAGQLLNPGLYDPSIESELCSEDIFGVSHEDYTYE